MKGKEFIVISLFFSLFYFIDGRIRYVIRNGDGDQVLELNTNSNGKQVYKDSGSGAYKDLGVWDPSNETGWYMAGQRAQPSHGGLSGTIVMVKELRPKDNPRLLVEPTDFKQVWENRGGLAYDDIGVWEMECPTNYVWLGHISHGCDGCRWPKPSWYKTRVRCVHNTMVDECTLERNPLWTNEGDTANTKASFWNYDTRVANRFSGFYMTRAGSYDEPPNYNRKVYCFKQHEEIEDL
ncbi:DgyrCDS11017 [Dimorphilus gyrociliatus]|uniref:DgyrCDS11017 n=1 Tax=Dimorphilus gyrociliatus TaxID=2664684 RepID=A0A7I8W213_9ANNE|nr:DgyrCDS11017 [Dimorphilus gyrociliatus]